MVQVEPLTPERLAGMIDHTFLKPYGDQHDIEKLCSEARAYHFAMVAINPAEVENCVRLLRGSEIRVGAAIGFPLGQNTSAVKRFEIKDAIDRGAGEIDMVINIRALKSGNVPLVLSEIKELAMVCRQAGVISKVILETCYLTESEKETVCHMAVASGVDFVKTSTGLGTAGATVEDVRLMRAAVGPDVGVKAAGGIRTLESALAMIASGATRIGTSAGITIVDSFRNRAAA